MSALDDKIAALQVEVQRNTAATNAAIAAHSNVVTPAQLQAIADATTALSTNDTTLEGLAAPTA